MPTETIAILLVEDNPTDASLVQEMLRDVEAFEFQLIHVSRLEEALTYLSATPSISVILLDLSGADTRWVDIVTRLLGVAPDIPVVVMGDGYDEAIALQALQQGAQDYLVKCQADGNLLIHSIRYAIARSAAPKAIGSPTRARRAIAKCNEAALLKSETTFLTLYESISAAVILLDENEIFDGNKAALQLFDCTDKELLCGKPMGEFSPPVQPNDEDSLSLANEYIATAIKQGSCRFDWMYRKCNGEEFPAEVTLTRIELGNRKVLQAVIYDISDRKATEMQLLQAKEAAEVGSRAKSEFLATISHELRTPLHAVLGLSQLLQQEISGTLNNKQKEYVSCIHSSGEHLLSLINDILDLSKVEVGKEQLTFVPLNIQDLCEYCLAMVREQAHEQGLQLTLHIEPQARIVIADERRCKQMLLNLLSNAVKFTPAGEVSLIVTKKPQGIYFTVKDTGIGIAADKLPLLFQPFRQLDSGLNRRFPGTGLGLALTQSLARLHGGDVTVKSTIAQGSEFTLCLPDWRREELILPSLPQELGIIEGDGYPPQAKSHILLVEDDDRTALVLKDYLQVIGHAVEHLTSGKDFLHKVRQFKPNLILMEVQLQGDCTGFDLLAALRRQTDTKNLKVVMVTEIPSAGKASQERFRSDIVRRCIEAGADDYLSKPIGIAQLEAILIRYL